VDANMVEPREPTPMDIDRFLSIVSYVHSTHNYGGLGSEIPRDALELFAAKLDQHKDTHQSANAHNRVFYLALPYEVWPHICALLKQKCMSDSGFNRLVLEKPFGRDTASALELNARLSSVFSEEHIYRMDRYLGKEIVENLLVMRFANRFFSPIWNRDNIKNVQIIFKEPYGAEDQNRTAYFDSQGIMRDVMQNHLLQILALVAMDKPASLSHEDIRDEKLKVLRCVQNIKDEDMVVAQYTAGNGHRGYKEHPSVADDSTAPTFCMAVLYVRNERWDGVPFILKAGKGLNERRSEVRIQLRDVPGDLFSEEQGQGPNEFVLRMQPEEELYLKMTIKKPGLGMNIVPSEMQLSEQWKLVQGYKSAKGIAPRRAYERLILDLIHGFRGHFVRDDELMAAWRVITPALERIDSGKIPMHTYRYGSRGPNEAEALRRSTGHTASIVAKDDVPLDSMPSSEFYFPSAFARKMNLDPSSDGSICLESPTKSQ